MERKSIDQKNRQPSGAAVMQTRVTDALTRAFFEEWATHGYAGIRLERVAARAGVGKAALYRRWRSKGKMAADLVNKVGLELSGAPDTGSLDGDVRALLHELRRMLRVPLVRRLLPDMLAENARAAKPSENSVRLGKARRERGAAVVDRAVARGELPADCDRELAADLIGAPLYWRLLVARRPIDAQGMERLARAIVAGLKAC
jgi:AcrR family transcriptional regulator